MIILDLNPSTDWWVAMVLGNTELTHLVNGHHVSVLEHGGVPREKVNETELTGVLLSVETTNPSPFGPVRADGSPNPSKNAALHNLWVKA